MKKQCKNSEIQCKNSEKIMEKIIEKGYDGGQ